MIYFKDAPIAPSKIDVEQLNRVNVFRQSLSDSSLSSVFEDNASFQSSLRAHLSMLAQKYSTSTSAQKRQNTALAELVTSNAAPATLGALEEDDDLGYLDYLDIYLSRLAEGTTTLDVISGATQKVGSQIDLRAKETYPGMDVKNAKRIVKLASEDMNVYAEVLRINLPLLSSSVSASMDALTKGLAFYDELSTGDTSQLVSTRSELANLIEIVLQSAGNIERFKSTVDGIPRMSSDLNKAKRALSAQLDSVVVEFKTISQTGRNIVASIDGLLKE
jgi:hypothetical protein